MATSTYTPIASITLGSSASSVTFSSIPQDYRDLVLVANFADNGSVYVRLNGDTSNNYSFVIMSSSGSASEAAKSFAQLGIAFVGSSERQTGIAQFLDYSATDKHKTILGRQGHTSEVAAATARWANTNAVTSIEVSAQQDFISTAYSAGSTFTLYGIEA